MRKSAFLILIALYFLTISSTYGQGVRLEPYEPGEGLTISQGGNSLRFTGFMQPMVETRAYISSEDKGNYTRFRMRRMVGRLTGEYEKYGLTYQLQLDLTGSSEGGGDGTTNNYLMDAWMAMRLNKNVKIKFGQDGPVTDTRELGMRSNALQLVERSPVSLAFSTIREFGMFIEAKYRVANYSFLAPTFCITNGDGANVFTNDRGGLKLGGKIDFIPFGNFNNFGQFRQADLEYEMTPKFAIGVNYSYNTGISDRRGRQSGTVLYLDSLNKEVLPDYQKWGIDFLFKYKGFSLLGEYVNAKANVPNSIAQRVRNDGTAATTFLVNGVQDVPSYVRGRIINGSGVNIQGGYMFKHGISLDARYAVLMPEANSFLRNPTFYNRSRFTTFCVSKYLGRNYSAKLQASVTIAKAEVGSTTLGGNAFTGKELTGNLMLTIAL